MTLGPSNGSPQVKAWDLSTRLFHWSLAVLVLASWASAEFADSLIDPTLKYHRWAGYGLLILLVWRVIWGFFGPARSRFSRFVKGPGAALAYAREVWAGTPCRFLGHNPLGGYMVLALLAILIVQSVLGLFVSARDELATGPLYKLIDPQLWRPVKLWHHFIFNRVILAVAGLHIAVNLYYQFVKREPLIRAMITGDKPDSAYVDAAYAGTARPSGVRALLCLVVSAALVFGLIIALGGKI